MPLPPAFIVNLPQCVERKERMTSRLNYYNIQHTFVEAIHKDSPLIDWYSSGINRIPREREITRAEIACLLSHLKALRTALRTAPQEKYYLILEDDAMFRDDTPLTLYDEWMNLGLDVINIGGQNFYNGLARNTFGHGLSWFHREKWGTWSCTGYLISRLHAERMLNILDRPFCQLPYNLIVAEVILRSAQKAVYCDPPCILEEGYDSTIRPRWWLEDHQRFFEQYGYHDFLKADGLTMEEFQGRRKG